MASVEREGLEKDFYDVDAKLAPPAICTSYERAHAVCRWYNTELRRDLMDKMAELVDGTDLDEHTDRLVLIGTQILEAALATGVVSQERVIETAWVALTLGSKLTERLYVPAKKNTDALAGELALLNALSWRLPRLTPFYILSILCDEIVSPPKNFHEHANALLGVLATTEEYCHLRRRAVAAGVAFAYALRSLPIDTPAAHHKSSFRIPDPHNEGPRLHRALQRAVGATSPIVA